MTITIEEMTEIKRQCAEIMVTKDKYYENKEKVDIAIEQRLRRMENQNDLIFKFVIGTIFIAGVVGIIKLAFFP